MRGSSGFLAKLVFEGMIEEKETGEDKEKHRAVAYPRGGIGGPDPPLF